MIIRTNKNRNYSVINNTVLQDERLSWRARGIAGHLFTKPDDWEINHVYLWQHGTEGRDAVLTAMKELEDCGYLVRTRIQKDDGTFTTIVVLHEEPQPTTENQKSVNQASVNQMSVNQESIVSTDYQVLNTKNNKEDDDDKARARGDVIKVWEKNVGMVTEYVGGQLFDLIDEVGSLSVIYGIHAAIESNVRTLRYVKTCARNHANGVEPQPKSAPSHRNNGKPKQEQPKTGYSQYNNYELTPTYKGDK